MSSCSIVKLPEDSRSMLRSTTILTSLSQIISELVQNSLDAESSHIDVGIDVDAWQCWVRDDGSGVDAAWMRLFVKGGEEARYATSKDYDNALLGETSTFGFRGEALASAADISCLEISSRTYSSNETWSIIFKGGKKLYYGPAVRWRRERPGTTVFIRDAFYNLPIRRRSHPTTSRTLEFVRKDMESIALVFPHVAFSLQNSAKENNKIGDKGRILAIPKTSSSLLAFRHLFGRVLCEHIEEIDVTTGDVRIQGFLSLDGAQSKVIKFIYINRHPLSPCEFHRIIESRFAASSFGKHASILTRRSPRKNERKAVYVLNVTIPPRSIDNCLTPAKNIIHVKDSDAVCGLLSNTIQSFLFKNGFASSPAPTPKKGNISRRSTGSPSPRKKRRLDINDMDMLCAPTTGTPAPPRPFSASNSNDEPVAITNPSTDHNRETRWTDPQSGQVYLVDRKTGNSYLANENRVETDNAPPHNIPPGRRSLVDTSRLRDPQVQDSCCSEYAGVPGWMQQALQGWKNPTFGHDEPGIPTLTSLSSASHQPWLKSLTEFGHGSNKHKAYFDAKLISGRRRNADDVSVSFDKEQLKHAEVIGQVDKKFVACLIETEVEDKNGIPNKVLILIDQHAADERIRVERFLSELCQGFLDHGTSVGVEVRELNPPVPILLTRIEARALARSEVFRQALQKWGFHFGRMNEIQSEQESSQSTEYVQVFVEAVPEVVGEKVLMAEEMRELIRGFLARLEDDWYDHDFTPDADSHWTTSLRWCPRELVDLVNSKACRGAIMFNDTLDIDQCKRLIFQLSCTVWPFMCAHGRPSSIPLINVAQSERKQKRIAWHSLDLI
ncbi:hypothetical protein BU17DRAFT_52124 [Hysterangium stoloniferum]|nr:hypothetical protein BU17DRAFT_52124 [Hysterangium stoloniferum]